MLSFGKLPISDYFQSRCLQLAELGLSRTVFDAQIQYKVTLNIDQRYLQCRKQASKQNIASTENSVLLVLQQLSKIIMLRKDVDVDYVLEGFIFLKFQNLQKAF